MCEAYHGQPVRTGDRLRRRNRAARIIQDALGIESDDVANYVFPKTWPSNREQRARIIGEWLRAEVRFLVSPSIVPE